MNGGSDIMTNEKKTQFDASAEEFVFTVDFKKPPLLTELSFNAMEFVPVTKIQLNIEAREYNPAFGQTHTKPDEITPLKVEESSTPNKPSDPIPQESEILSIPPADSLSIPEEAKKIDTQSNIIPIESVLISASPGNLHEVEHVDHSPIEEQSLQKQYTVDMIIDVYKEFYQYEEFLRIENSLEQASRRKYNIYRSYQRSSSPKKKNAKREHLRVEEFKKAESDSWRKKKSLEEQKISEAAKKTTLKLTSTIEEQEKVKRTIKITLNKLSPNNLEKLKLDLLAIGKESRLALNTLTEYIFEKAWSEIKYTQMYASLCKFLKSELKDYQYQEDSPGSNPNYFRYELLVMVENAFRNTSDPSFINKDPEIQAALSKKKTQGNVRFIGELLKVGIVGPRVIQQCVETLLRISSSDPLLVTEDSIEGACILISTAGACFEKKKLIEETDKIFRFLGEILDGNLGISKRVKFLIMNLIDERANNWNKDLTEQPKTVEEIRSTFMQEKEDIANRNRY